MNRTRTGKEGSNSNMDSYILSSLILGQGFEFLLSEIIVIKGGELAVFLIRCVVGSRYRSNWLGLLAVRL